MELVGIVFHSCRKQASTILNSRNRMNKAWYLHLIYAYLSFWKKVLEVRIDNQENRNLKRL